MNRTTIALGLSTLMLALTPAVEAGKYYRWVDEEGVTHYTATPPPDGKESEEVRTLNTRSSDAPAAKEKLDQMRAQTNAERTKAAAAAERKAETEEEMAGAEEQSKERCEQHRQNLETLKNKAVVRKEDPVTGEVTTMTEEEKQEMLEKTQRVLEMCEEGN